MKNARLIDPFSRNTHHEVINLTWIIMLAQIYTKVEYIGEENYLKKIQMQASQLGYSLNNVYYKPIKIHNFKRWKSLNFLFYLAIVSFRDIYYYMNSPKYCDVFYNNNTYFSLITLSLISILKRNKLYILCHSELENIHIKWNGYINYIYGIYLRICFKCIPFNRHFHFIVLGDNMKKYISTIISSNNAKRFYSIDHPYIREQVSTPLLSTKNNDFIKIGIISLIKKGRGLNNLNKLLSQKLPENIKIFPISKISGSYNDIHQIIDKTLNPNNELLPSELYLSNIQKMDYILMLYDTNGYKLTASGSILEAIWNEKPIIALSNEYFKYLFDKYGEMGVLCSTIEELHKTITEFNNIPNKETWIKNMQKVKNILLSQNSLKKLSEIINS